MKKNDKMSIKKVQKKILGAVKQATNRLEDIGKDTKEFVKHGEGELVKISRLGKAQFEILALSVKKEQLYRQIGMKVWQLSTHGNLTTKNLQSLCEELSQINKKVKNEKKSINVILRKKESA